MGRQRGEESEKMGRDDVGIVPYASFNAPGDRHRGVSLLYQSSTSAERVAADRRRGNAKA